MMFPLIEILEGAYEQIKKTGCVDSGFVESYL